MVIRAVVVLRVEHAHILRPHLTGTQNIINGRSVRVCNQVVLNRCKDRTARDRQLYR